MSNYKPKVLVTWKEIEGYIRKNKSKLKKIHFDFFFQKQSIRSNILKKKIQKYSGLICGDDEIDSVVLKKAKNLKIISKWGTGIDSINLELCKKKKIKVYNTPGAFTHGVSQLAFCYILALSRNIIKIDQLVRKNYWPKFKGQLLDKRKVGIIGFGKIGKNLGKIVKKNNMDVFFYDIKKKISFNKNIFKRVSLKQVLKYSDFLVICCDLNETSKSLINFKEIKQMKKTSYIINVARGPIINENDLISCLKNNTISGAALDVFEKEPLSKKNLLKKIPNCILGSHNAFNTIDETEIVNKKTLQNVINNL